MRRTPLRYLANLNAAVLPEDTDSNFRFRYVDISQVSSAGEVAIPEEDVAFGEAPSRARRLAASGDTLVSTVRTYLRAIAPVPPSADPLVFSTGFAVLSPREDPRFLSYACRSDEFVEEVVSRSVGVSYPAIAPGDLMDIGLPAPEESEQRRIADFLDDRVARIDQIISARSGQIDYIESASAIALETVLASRGIPQPASVEHGWEREHVPSSWRVTTLGRVLRQLTNGFVGPTRDILVESGVRYIQGTHIKHGQIDFERRPFYVSEAWHDQRSRIHLGAGDILIVQTGDIGQVAMVPEGFGPASCHALLIARVEPALVQSPYLSAFLRSAFGQAAMGARATGALHPHLEAGVKTVPVLLPPIDAQVALANEVDTQRNHYAELSEHLRRSIAKLREYKQSLITAAVTGEIDVTTAGGGIPG